MQVPMLHPALTASPCDQGATQARLSPPRFAQGRGVEIQASFHALLKGRAQPRGLSGQGCTPLHLAKGSQGGACAGHTRSLIQGIRARALTLSPMLSGCDPSGIVILLLRCDGVLHGISTTVSCQHHICHQCQWHIATHCSAGP